MRPTFTFFITLLISQLIFGQQLFEGIVSDEKGEPISYAHVFLKNQQQTGSVTNEEGYFIFRISESIQDTLVCSILGYETLYTPIKDLEEDVKLVLHAEAYLLDEVTIISDEYLRHLLKESIQNIPNNYPVTEHQLLAYQQDFSLSNGEYSELIESDLTITSNGYQKDKRQRDIYLNQLRKTDDNRNLRDDLKTAFGNSKIIYDYNPLIKRAFKRIYPNPQKVERTILDLEDEVSHSEVSIYAKHMIENDTILTIKFEHPQFGRLGVFTLLSLNLSDMAFVEIQQGTIWDEDSDWNIYKYRKVNGVYYPVFSKNVTSIEFNSETAKHYNVKTLYVYDIKENKSDFIKPKRKNKFNNKKDLRKIKYSYDEAFWEVYPYPNLLPSTTAVMNALNNQQNINEQFKKNERKKLFGKQKK